MNRAILSTHETRSILLIDNNENLSASLAIIFRRCGIHLKSAPICEEAHWILANHRPSMVLMELNPRDVENVQLFREIRFRFPQLPVIVFTSYLWRDADTENFQGEVFKYIYKPVDPMQLIELVQSIA